jgi:hypothetical protein
MLMEMALPLVPEPREATDFQWISTAIVPTSRTSSFGDVNGNRSVEILSFLQPYGDFLPRALGAMSNPFMININILGLFRQRNRTG